MTPRRIDMRLVLPLSLHEVELTHGEGGLHLSVSSTGWPDGPKMIWNIWPDAETAGELRAIADAIEILQRTGTWVCAD